jgi:glucose/mannose-6-phosphate isomerase
VIPDHLLDSPSELEAGDPAGMLRAVASSAAQVREAAVRCFEADVARLAAEDLPRAVVVLGMGGSGIGGDVLAALGGPACPVPVVSVKGHTLPVWVGAADLVIAVSYSGRTEETLVTAQEAARRGCRMVVVGAESSPLAMIASQARAIFVPAGKGRQPRASMFALTTPLVIAGDALGLLSCSLEEVEATAVLLEQLAVRYGPTSETAINPAKALAANLLGQLPVVWGGSPLAAAAAYRFACQLNENSKLPAVWGALPEVGHNQIVPLDGPFARRPDEDLFRDRLEDEGDEACRMHVILLRDPDEHPRVKERAEVVNVLARDRGVAVTQVVAEGSSAFQRLASLVSMADWTTTYLGLAQGIDPTPVRPIDELKLRLG